MSRDKNSTLYLIQQLIGGIFCELKDIPASNISKKKDFLFLVQELVCWSFIELVFQVNSYNSSSYFFKMGYFFT